MADAKPRGRFVWFDLMTTDPAVAPAFYSRVTGWGTAPWPGPTPYTMWTNSGVPIGGVMTLPPDAGAPPHWLAYISSPDVDGHGEAGRIARREDAGRAQRRADGRAFRRALRSAGRRVCDLHAGGRGARPRRRARWCASSRGTSWRRATSPAAYPFLRALFGWNKSDRHGHGRGRPVPDVRPERRRARRHVQQRPRRCPDRRPGRTTSWSTTSNAPSKPPGLGGGQILNGPMEVPGGDWIFQALIPRARCSPFTREEVTGLGFRL